MSPAVQTQQPLYSGNNFGTKCCLVLFQRNVCMSLKVKPANLLRSLAHLQVCHSYLHEWLSTSTPSSCKSFSPLHLPLAPSSSPWSPSSYLPTPLSSTLSHPSFSKCLFSPFLFFLCLLFIYCPPSPLDICTSGQRLKVHDLVYQDCKRSAIAHYDACGPHIRCIERRWTPRHSLQPPNAHNKPTTYP